MEFIVATKKKTVSKKKVTAKAKTKSVKKSVAKKSTAKKSTPKTTTKKKPTKGVTTKKASKKTAAPKKKTAPKKTATKKKTAAKKIITKTETSVRSASTPLIVEKHPKEYTGYPFITLLQHRDNHLLAIVDNFDGKTISAFVLDLCGPENVLEEDVINIAKEWHDNLSKFPISFEFSRRGVSNRMSKILKTFNVDFIARVIGPLPQFPMNNVKSVKRRRRKPIPAGVEVNKKIVRF